MRKLWLAAIFTVIISFTLMGCSDDADAGNNNANENEENDNEEVEAENENDDEVENEDEDDSANNEDNDNDEVVDENTSDANEEEVEDEAGSFAGEIDVMDVDKVLLDEDAARFERNGSVFIKHDDLMYVEQEFITDLLNYELTYDEENTVAEIYEKKGDFKYEPSYREEGGAIMDTGQVYVDDQDDYIDIPSDFSDLFKFIEYEGKLYVPKMLVNAFMKAPIHYKRRDKEMEVGLQTETTDLYDVGLDDDSSSSAEVTKDASDVTIEGENYEGGVIISNVNSAKKAAVVETDYDYSEISGFIHNKSDEYKIDIKFSYDGENIIETIELEPEETKEFEYEVNGAGVFYMETKGAGGGTDDAVIIGELR